MRVLVHICCGPCSITVLSELLDLGHEPVGLFYNPNIHPLSEYLRRRDGALQVAQRLGVGLTVLDREYDPMAHLGPAADLGDERCGFCYALRLNRTAALAAQQGIEAFTSTLLYSKFQKHEGIVRAGERAALAHGGDFLYRDFRTGWKEGIRLSKLWGIYRQQYCGCLFSEFERYRNGLQSGEA